MMSYMMLFLLNALIISSLLLTATIIANSVNGQPDNAPGNVTIMNPTKQPNKILRDPDGPEVQFFYIERNNSEVAHAVYPGKKDVLLKYGFDNTLPTKIIIHGYLSSVNADIVNLLKKAYTSTGMYNVMAVDWSVLCGVEYFSAMKGARYTADSLATMLDWMAREVGLNVSDVHVAAHSLGAHVAGMTSSRLHSGKLGRITGLDPAGPGFRDLPDDYRLDRGDADLVDVIHTYSRLLSMAAPAGHVDFYPNGGRSQPGCPSIFNLKEYIYCNHGRAYWLFEETVRNRKAFKTKRCNTLDEALQGRCNFPSKVYMGQADTYKPGIYYLDTKAMPPYTN